jgi:hypothetical protein
MGGNGRRDAKDMELVWWHWMILGLGLGLVELVVPAFFVIWFGLGALLVGVCLAGGAGHWIHYPDTAYGRQRPWR